MFQQELFLEFGVGKTIQSIYLKNNFHKAWNSVLPIIEEKTHRAVFLHVPVIYISLKKLEISLFLDITF